MMYRESMVSNRSILTDADEERLDEKKMRDMHSWYILPATMVLVAVGLYFSAL